MPMRYDAIQSPPGIAPALSRLAYNRLSFGPRPEDHATFGSFDLAPFVDSQLAYEAIDDSACEAYVAGLVRTDSLGLTVPALDGTVAEIQGYSKAVNNAGAFGPTNLQRHLWTATYARALLSKRQLFEVMVDFWTNHFHTNSDSPFKYWEDHNVIRQHALGNFRDLLGASARSPSMLTFLSNGNSDGSNPNENYGRELMELHTLGSYSRVLGASYQQQPNYTEDDVHTAALILTGWTTVNSASGEFVFNGGRSWPAHHWPEKWMSLGGGDGTVFPFGGIEQGEQLLDILSVQPSTAYHIAFKLCRRFISDKPDTYCPDAMEAGAQAFLTSHGDIRATVRAIVLHPKFASSWGEKVKRPFEFFISTLRAMGATAMVNFLPEDWSDALGGRFFDDQIGLLGQKLFDFGAPTGLPDFRTAWWNTNQVFGRWNMANGLVNKYFSDQLLSASAPVNPALDTWIGAPATATQVVDRLIANFIGHDLDPADRTLLINYLGANNSAASISSATPTLRPTLGIIAASPYAQWR